MKPFVYVDIYIGQTRAAGWIRRLEALGFGEMCVREEVPPRRTPWAFDNGAFRDWNADRPFDEERFKRAIDTIHLKCPTHPDFLAAPDIVAGGAKSLAFSLSWVDRLKRLGPVYLVVQDGMDLPMLQREGALSQFAGLFVGGTPEWKLRTARNWAEVAHAYGMKCHVGRMGTTDRVRAALRWGVDSIDSCLPLWSEANLQRFLRGFNPELTTQMFPEVA